jgi:hypothetical protein
MPSAFVQFFGGGWHRYSIPRTLLFFTERRIIAFRLRRRMRRWIWNRGLRTLYWGDLLGATPGGFLSRHLTLKFRNGQKQAYWRFPLGRFKKIKLLIQILQTNGTGESSAAGGMVSLCPSCLATLAAGNHQCPSCGVRFKDEKTLVWRGIVIPGGASLYVGANGLGALRGVFEAIVLFVIFSSILSAIREPHASKAAAGLLAGIAAECVILALDKVMAIALSLSKVRDFIPVE